MSCVELIDWLEDHQLLTPGQIREIRPLLPAFPELKLLAKALILRDWLSPYQLNQILSGKGDQLVLGVLRLRERLGEGAMGQVFKAWNTRLEQTVAVKTLHKDLIANARAMDRFRQEIEAVSQLDHPNIVKVRDADEIDSRPYMVMDFVNGHNLSYLVKRYGALPIPVAAEAIRQAAVGLQHAYERGVVHRDIKPANLLIESAKGRIEGIPQDTDFCVKILDFGLARFDSERRYSTRLTQPGSTLGTVDYMAPEQAESARDADVRADVYGLGCTFFFVLTGKPPFPGSSIAEKIAARLTGQPPSLRESRPDVPPGLEAIVQKMMARWPADRYQTPAQVAIALRAYAHPPRLTDEMPAFVEGLEPAASFSSVPQMEIDRRSAPTAKPPLAQSIAAAGAGPAAEVPLAMPIGPQSPSVLLPPAEEGLFPPEPPNQFPLVDQTDAAGAATAPSKRQAMPPTKPGMDRRLIIALGAGIAAVLFLIIGCGGYLLVSWSRTPPPNDVYPPGAELQLIKVELSTMNDTIRIGRKHNVIATIRRAGTVSWDGPVDVKLERLPPGVNSSPAKVAKGMTKVEVPITASFGIEPVEADIEVVATAKNLHVRRKLHIRAIPDKGK
jgi:serine/threonine protein kinase